MSESTEDLRRLIDELGIAHESEVARQLRTYLALLEKWNPKVNLTSTTHWSGIEPLFREAIWASTIYPEDAVSHLDIGSGAGFPAVPLRIMKPQIHLEMVESRAKKGVFLEVLACALGIEGMIIHNVRLDKFLRSCDRNKRWDCVSWKALKLGSEDLRLLRDHAHKKTQFWMFHGKELAVTDPTAFEQSFCLMRRERFEPGRVWFLSIYALQEYAHANGDIA